MSQEIERFAWMNAWYTLPDWMLDYARYGEHEALRRELARHADKVPAVPSDAPQIIWRAIEEPCREAYHEANRIAWKIESRASEIAIIQRVVGDRSLPATIRERIWEVIGEVEQLEAELEAILTHTFYPLALAPRIVTRTLRPYDLDYSPPLPPLTKQTEYIGPPRPARVPPERDERIVALRSEITSHYRRFFRALVNRDGRICQYCEVVEGLQIDHVMPVSRGGANDLDNLQLLCARCNRWKSNRLPEDIGHERRARRLRDKAA